MLKKLVSIVMVALLAFGTAGCGNKTAGNDDNKVTITIGGWPTKANEKEFERQEALLKKFNEKYPNIEVIKDEWTYSADTFMPLATSNRLPNVFYIPFTEVTTLMNGNYAADITAAMDKYGYTDILTDSVRDLISRDGKIYMFPVGAYNMALYVNRNIMKDAGELDSDGQVIFPKTLDELSELAGRIKRKTGKDAIGMSAWPFMNIAWAFGTEFMKQNKDGSYTATFNSKSCADAFKWLSDLKWKYNAYSQDIFVTNDKAEQAFCTDQLAMTIEAVNEFGLKNKKTKYNMDKDVLAIGRIPAGPAGQYSLTGGSLYAISSNSTPEQIDAVFKWLDMKGYGVDLTQESKVSIEQEYKDMADEGYIVGLEQYSHLKGGDAYEYRKQMRSKYANVDPRHFEDYTNNIGSVTMKPEEPKCAQQLYTIIRNCMEQVLTDKDTDIEDMLKKAEKEFQEVLDKEQ